MEAERGFINFHMPLSLEVELVSLGTERLNSKEVRHWQCDDRTGHIKSGYLGFLICHIGMHAACTTSKPELITNYCILQSGLISRLGISCSESLTM
jgi:hypothetical protein